MIVQKKMIFMRSIYKRILIRSNLKNKGVFKIKIVFMEIKLNLNRSKIK